MVSPIFTFHNRLEPKFIPIVFDLWNQEYPEKLVHDSHESMNLYLEKLESPKYILCHLDGNLIGWASIFTRENERWFFLIISSQFHKKGIGKKFIQKITTLENRINGWVIDHSNDKKMDGHPTHLPYPFMLNKGFLFNQI
jgi:hypothetical protein